MFPVDTLMLVLCRDIPVIREKSDFIALPEYSLPVYPPFTAGMFYILSRDIIRRLIADKGPRLFIKDEDQVLGVWLYPYNIRPVHDRRIQQVDVCENDMIAKHFSDHFEPGLGMRDMYANIAGGYSMCTNFRQSYCAICYPCINRKNHWNEWNFDCDAVRGITLLKNWGQFSEKSELESSAIDPPEPIASFTQGDKNKTADEWIVPNLLKPSTCVLSNTPDWHLLHWVLWTTDASTFQDRHFRTLDLIFAHEPRAVVIMLTPTLPKKFFSSYTKSGYRIYVVRCTREKILANKWYLGANSEWWANQLRTWSSSKYFFSHLTDYLRYVVLYKYGGVYMDMDALWLRMPPKTDTEFIGSDISSSPEDAEWAMDAEGTYLAPGVMRFKRGWRVFKELVESTFDRNYDPSCFNCVGPRAITKSVRWQRKYLALHGFEILPSHYLYPYGYTAVHKLLKTDLAAQEILESLMDQAWSVHLFGKLTNDKPIEEGSVVDAIFKRFGLMLPKYKDTTPSNPFELIAPKTYQRPETVASMEWAGTGVEPGSFTGLDLIFARGGALGSFPMTLTVSVKSGWLSWGHDGARFQEATMSSNAATLGDINRLLSKLTYHWQTDDATKVEQDEVSVTCTFNNETVSAAIQVFGVKSRE